MLEPGISNGNKRICIRRWNVNGGWFYIDKNFMKDSDIRFIRETHCNVKSQGGIKGFTEYGDPSFPMLQHGGIAVYIRDIYGEYVKDLCFSKSTVSFTINVIPCVAYGCRHLSYRLRLLRGYGQWIGCGINHILVRKWI